MGVKTLAHEVAIAMGKDEFGDEVVDRTSDILKYLKACEMLHHSLSFDTKQVATVMIKKALSDGTRDLYDKVLLGRRP